MLSRLSAVRRLPRTFAFRYYTDGRTAGTVAQSPGSFSKKEQAQENQYVRRQEQAQIAKLRAEIAEKKALLDALETGGEVKETKE